MGEKLVEVWEVQQAGWVEAGPVRAAVAADTAAAAVVPAREVGQGNCEGAVWAAVAEARGMRPSSQS